MWCGRPRESTGQNGVGDGRALQLGVVVADHCEKNFSGQERHGYAKGHGRLCQGAWAAVPRGTGSHVKFLVWHRRVFRLFYGVFGLCFGWGLCSVYFRGSLWTKRKVLWENQMRVFRILDWKGSMEECLSSLRRIKEQGGVDSIQIPKYQKRQLDNKFQSQSVTIDAYPWRILVLWYQLKWIYNTIWPTKDLIIQLKT